MANKSPAGPSVHATLVASTVDVVTLPGPYRHVEVINRDASADLWVTVDHGLQNGVTLTPTVAGDGCLYVGPGAVRVIDTVPGDAAGTDGSASRVVRLISASAVAYSVTGL
jgi:hypothetical protein